MQTRRFLLVVEEPALAANLIRSVGRYLTFAWILLLFSEIDGAFTFESAFSRARVTHAPYRDFYLFAFTTFTRLHNLSPKKEGKTSQFRKVVFQLFLPFILSILGIFANSVPNTLVSCWLIICYAWFVKVVKAKSMKLLLCARNAHARRQDVRF